MAADAESTKSAQGITLADFEAVVLNANQADVTRLLSIRFKALAEDIIDFIPPSAHRSAALRQLLETKMTTIHAVSRSPEVHY